MPHTYPYPRPAVTVDVVVLGSYVEDSKSDLEDPHVLLIQRAKEPFKDCWALPGGFVDENEDLEAAAKRELLEETNLRAKHIQQVGAFGKPGRDPRGHVVSIAFVYWSGYIRKVKAGDDAKAAKWFPVRDLPPLAFDHKDIIQAALFNCI